MQGPPSTYIALLRGVNVGRANRVAMADLRRLLDDLGFAEVRTLLNSGNAVFEARGWPRAEIASAIEAALTHDLGVISRVVLLSAEDVACAVRENPLLPVKEPSRFVVAFLAPDANADSVRELCNSDWSPENFSMVGRVAYLSCVNGITGSAVAGALARAAGPSVTSRNWATVVKLAEMASR